MRGSSTATSAGLMARAAELMPGGVSSPVRAFTAVGGVPRVIAQGAGARLWDVDGREYVDYVGSWGPMILGHAHPAVVAAVTDAAQRGTSYGAPSSGELEMAEVIVAAMPAIERIRFVSSGTEAAMSAVRLARAFTGRDRIVKMAGGYHGHADALLVKAGSGASGLPASAGVTPGAARDTLVAPYNDLHAATLLVERNDVAALIVEPVAANMGVVAPAPGYLEGVRALTERHGTLLIFDEVITGFRLGRGGAQERFGVTPDLTVLGKIIGGGLPVGAYGGRADVMSLVAPLGPVYQAGTLSGNPLAMAAGLATLRELDGAIYARLEDYGARLEAGLNEAGAPRVARVGSLLTVFVEDFAGFFHAMLDAGIYLPPSQQEAWFISAAHGEAEIAETLAAARSALGDEGRVHAQPETGMAATTQRPTGEARFMAAANHQRGDATPVWFMRQAGRCLADYRRLRERFAILTLAKTPELCAEVTLMPVEAFGVDAAVLFADIMLPLEPMGVSLEIQPEIGPIIHNPVRSAADVERLRLIEPAEEVSFVMDAIGLVRRELAGRQAVIGFSGAPFTLACYLIEGRPSREYAIAKAFMYREPDGWHALMEKLSTVVVRYLQAQIAAGAQTVQLFDSWIGGLSPADYATYVQPHVRRIFSEVTGAPTIHFGTSTASLLELMTDAGGTIQGIDARQALDVAWERIGFQKGIQGNLDATRLLAGWEATEAGARDVLGRAAGRPGHIFNLGHGVLPETDPGLLRRLVDFVHEESAA